MEVTKACFDVYTHSQAIIYSTLDGQYQGQLKALSSNTWVLFTPFDFHYVCGAIPKTKEPLRDLIRSYVRAHEKKMFVLCSPNHQWHPYIHDVFKELHGVSDERSRFDLDEKTFLSLFHQHTFTHDVTLTHEIAYESSFSFPVANITKNGKRIAYTRALMFGKNHVELDVFTDEAHRQQGCAFETSLILINHLLKEGFIPQWSCWIHNEASITLAKKLGFKFIENIDAYVWVDSFGPL